MDDSPLSAKPKVLERHQLVIRERWWRFSETENVMFLRHSLSFIM